jgi:hypothetical protein
LFHKLKSCAKERHGKSKGMYDVYCTVLEGEMIGVGAKAPTGLKRPWFSSAKKIGYF